jgi:hypothetical protein
MDLIGRWAMAHAEGLAWLSLAGWLFCWGWAFVTARRVVLLRAAAPTLGPRIGRRLRGNLRRGDSDGG